MKKTPIAALLLCVPLWASAQGAVSQEEGPWMVRVRALAVSPANGSTPIGSLGVPSNDIHVSDKLYPEIDITRFITKNIAAELILTVPQKHDVDVKSSIIGAFKAGSFKLLPPTLTLQYHFRPDADFRPYVGAGVTYSRYSSVNLRVPGVTGLHLDRDYVGGAVQAGFDYKIAKNLFFNMDVKKLMVRSDLENDAGVKLSRLKVDPFIVGVGLGWRF